jgi:hypothetical protein
MGVYKMSKEKYKIYRKEEIQFLESVLSCKMKEFNAMMMYYFEGGSIVMLEEYDRAHVYADEKVKEHGKCTKYGKKRSKLEKKLDKLKRDIYFYNRLTTSLFH